MTLWSLFCGAFGIARLFRNSAVFNPEAYGNWKRDSIRQVDFVSGCFLLIRRDLWQQLGGFDEDFFMYAEEADLCQRARALGARPVITPDATIVHYAGASETVASAKLVKLLAGKMTYARKHWVAAKVFGAQRLLEAMVLIRIAAFSLRKWALQTDDKERAREWRHVWRRRREWINGYSRRTEQGERQCLSAPVP
jgi:GT2 family glycosyltransferase